jgi:hypothetical protein
MHKDFCSVSTGNVTSKKDNYLKVFCLNLSQHLSTIGSRSDTRAKFCFRSRPKFGADRWAHVALRLRPPEPSGCPPNAAAAALLLPRLLPLPLPPYSLSSPLKKNCASTSGSGYPSCPPVAAHRLHKQSSAARSTWTKSVVEPLLGPATWSTAFTAAPAFRPDTPTREVGGGAGATDNHLLEGVSCLCDWWRTLCCGDWWVPIQSALAANQLRWVAASTQLLENIWIS